MPEFTAALISLLMDSNVTMIYLAIIKGRGNVILNRTGLEHQSYDYIVATYSLHHLKDEQKVNFLRTLYPWFSF